MALHPPTGPATVAVQQPGGWQEPAATSQRGVSADHTSRHTGSWVPGTTHCQNRKPAAASPPVLEQVACPLHKCSGTGLVTGCSMRSLHVQHAADSGLQGPAAPHGSPGLLAHLLAKGLGLCCSTDCTLVQDMPDFQWRTAAEEAPRRGDGQPLISDSAAKSSLEQFYCCACSMQLAPECTSAGLAAVKWLLPLQPHLSTITRGCSE